MEIRRSSRLNESRKTDSQPVNVEDNFADQSPSLEPEDDFFPSSDESDSERFRLHRRAGGKKRRLFEHDERSASKYVRGRRGILRLERITQAPVDILLEIFSYLEPLDVLRLSRTTKELRGFLMKRSSASLVVWRTARANVAGLPPLPQDLSEPEYANLAFDSYCHFCFRTRCENIIWQCRVRCCLRCFPIVFFSRPDLHSVWRTSYPLTFLVFQKVAGYIPYVSVTQPRTWGLEDKVYLPSIVRKFRHEYRAVHSDEKLLEEWIISKREQYDALEKHVSACVEWHKVNALSRSAIFYEMREQRRFSIYRKLRDLGWADEINFFGDEVSRHRLVNRAKELTEKDWVKIEPQLVQFMETLRSRWLERIGRMA